MARKDSAKPAEHRGFSDIIGIVLIAAALLLLLAQLSFDRYDIDANKLPANQTKHNWIGGAGAWGANVLFQIFGAGAFVLPLLLLVFGLGYLFEFFAYLKRRWAWAGVLFLTCLGWFDLYTHSLETLRLNINAPSAGGYLGKLLNDLVFRHLGKPGATIIFCTLYLISLIFLTNFQLGPWLRAWASRLSQPNVETEDAPDATAEEKSLTKRSRELEKQARKLQDQLDESRAREKPLEEKNRPGLGPDLRPVPLPTVRDLSVPVPRTGKAAVVRVEEPPIARGELEGEIISATEIAAASTSDILGDKAELSKRASSRAAKMDKAAAVAESPESSTPVAEAADADKIESEKTEEPAGAVAAAAPPAEPRFTDNSGGARRPVLKKKPIAVASTPVIGNYQMPPLDFLQYPDMTVKSTESKEDLMANARLMQQTLAQFDIDVSLGDITKGPTITRYELHPAPGVKLEKIAGLNNNIAAALKAERINILAPVPGKSSVGIEVPNAVKTKVIMRDLLESEEWQKNKARIPLALGKDVYGHPIIADLSDMPHLLIAGSTGSGKSVCINSIIASLLYKFPPDQLRFVMIDPKVVELQQYNALPHLVVPVVTDPKKVILALRWVVNEMEKRYQIFAKVGVRNIKSFNERPKGKAAAASSQSEFPLTAKKEKVEPGADGFAVEVDEEIVVPRDDDIVIPDKLSYIVVIIDELADLMLVAPADVEMAIARITQMARAAGIHCIVATQRPSVDVITGVIKANIPARIAFQVASRVDSRTILDAMGADKLLGKGDMLYLPPGSAKLIRAQGALITDQEIQSLVDFIAKQGKPSYEVEIHQQLQKPVSTYESGDAAEQDEELIEQCIEVIRSEQKASVSLLQRRLKIGYGRAARIMDELENRGIVGPSNGAEPRDILIDLDGGGADGLGVETGTMS
ncbi:MAG: segregation ATPase FtsK/SpoIIIE, family [Verrucomicrobiota bacterium]|jgi:S-DNA-T family DNA segregation ATPase FtsK/SpoIIIE